MMLGEITFPSWLGLILSLWIAALMLIYEFERVRIGLHKGRSSNSTRTEHYPATPDSEERVG